LGSDYIIDLALVLLVVRQIRPRMLTTQSALLPLALVGLAGLRYVRAFPTAGHDLLLDLVLVIMGVACGAISGLGTNVWRSDAGTVMARAGAVAATAWVLGMGFRMGFDVWAHTTAGQHSLLRFSIHQDITSAQAYVVAFVLMAFAQVVVRVAILQLRRSALAAPASAVAA